MSKAGAEHRREERIDVECLPDELQTLFIHLNPVETIQVNITDASTSGVGFISEADPSNFITGTNIILYPRDEAYPIFGRIIYTRKKTGNKIKVGVQIKDTSALDQYRKIINTILIR